MAARAVIRPAPRSVSEKRLFLCSGPQVQIDFADMDVTRGVTQWYGHQELLLQPLQRSGILAFNENWWIVLTSSVSIHFSLKVSADVARPEELGLARWGAVLDLKMQNCVSLPWWACSKHRIRPPGFCGCLQGFCFCACFHVNSFNVAY